MADIGSVLAATVIFLFSANQNGTTPIGTAFIVGYPIVDRPNAYIPLVVTAKHVIADHPTVIGRFTTKEGKTPAGAVYDMNKLRQAGDYWEHDDAGVDITIFRTAHFETAQYEVVPLDLIASKDDFRTSEIQTTDRVVFPGLLPNFMGSTRNYPIVRSGSIALIPDEPVPVPYVSNGQRVESHQEVLLIDGTAVPGESGSPVFLSPAPRTRQGGFTVGTRPLLLGIVHGFFNAQPREVIPLPTAPTQVFAENSNIAIVFPSWRIREILESPRVSLRMMEIVKHLPPEPAAPSNTDQ